MNHDSWYDPPEERDRMCECGDLESAHDDINTEAMQEALEKIISACDSMLSSHQQWVYEINHIAGFAHRALSICSGKDCECRKFVEAIENEPDEDFA